MHTLALHLKEIQGKSLLLAHSGGVDSCVLAHVLLQNKMPFSVAHCNFQLRAKASNEDSEFVKKWCAAHKIPFHSHSFDTELYKEKFKKGTPTAIPQYNLSLILAAPPNESSLIPPFRWTKTS